MRNLTSLKASKILTKTQAQSITGVQTIMKHLESITISGELRGNIWMPDCECTKDFTHTFAPKGRHNPFQKEWIDLREALLDITNDGDFQSCGIDYAYIETTWTETELNGRNRRVSVGKYLNPGKFISDLFN